MIGAPSPESEDASQEPGTQAHPGGMLLENALACPAQSEVTEAVHEWKAFSNSRRFEGP